MGLLCLFSVNQPGIMDRPIGGYHLVLVINFDSWKLFTQILDFSHFSSGNVFFGMVTLPETKQLAPVKFQPGPKKEEFHHFNPLIFRCQLLVSGSVTGIIKKSNHFEMFLSGGKMLVFGMLYALAKAQYNWSVN